MSTRPLRIGLPPGQARGGKADEDPENGRELARAYYRHVVGPLLTKRWPDGLPHAAGRLGGGSDVLGLDDAASRDHDWGLRLTLLVDEEVRDSVDAYLADALPESFAGMPTRIAFTGQTVATHAVEVDSPSGFARARLGFDPREEMQLSDWLSLTGQAVLEVVAGPVFVDTPGALTDIRRALQWFPDDVWRHVVACDWARLEEEMPLMGRAGDRGDDLGSRVIAARLVDVAMHLGFLLERRWPPYAKWRGTAFGTLRRTGAVGAALTSALTADDWRARQSHLARALEALLEIQASAGLPADGPATVGFWDRPYLHPPDALVEALLRDITDEDVQALPRGRGSIEQQSDNVALLVDADARRAAVASVR